MCCETAVITPELWLWAWWNWYFFLIVAQIRSNPTPCISVERVVDVTVSASCPPGHLLSLQQPVDKGMTFPPVLHPPNHQPVRAWPLWKRQYSTRDLNGIKPRKTSRCSFSVAFGLCSIFSSKSLKTLWCENFVLVMVLQQPSHQTIIPWCRCSLALSSS